MGLQGGLNALVQMSGAISETGGGGGGSEVSYTATLQSGTQIGTLTIDDIDYNLYAPEGGDSVEYTAIQQSGTKIGTITINDTSYDIYAPTGGGGGSDVSFTQVLGSGTKIGTITIDDTPTDIYAPTPPDAVSYTEIQQSGKKIGTITIGSTSTDIYAPPSTTVSYTNNVPDLNKFKIGTLTVNNNSTDLYMRNLQLANIGSTNYIQIKLNYGDDEFFFNVPTKLEGLDNINISSPTNGQILKYNSTSQKWVNANESGGGGGGIDYSTTEQDTGLEWLDGRPVYQKTYHYTTVVQGVSVLDSSFTKTLYDHVWHTDIHWIYSDINIDLGNHGGTGGAIYIESYNNQGLYAVNQTGVDIQDLWFTIRYTKTADLTP